MASDPRLRRDDPYGNFNGFASTYGTYTWQMTIGEHGPEAGEIFADQFLAWTYDTYYGDLPDQTIPPFLDQANARRNWMNKHMPDFLGE